MPTLANKNPAKGCNHQSEGSQAKEGIGRGLGEIIRRRVGGHNYLNASI